MSKSKKNTIDPEKIIENYGADSVRLFILSDSPPEKDVQWSEEGITSAFKFTQKFWALNQEIIDEIKKDYKEELDYSLENISNKFVYDVENNIEKFSYNKIIANFHEVYSSLKKLTKKRIAKRVWIENYTNILLTMSPVIPHLANECMELIDKISNISKKKLWPEINKDILLEKESLIVVQINGKKRDLIKTKLNTTKEEIEKLVYKNDKLAKYLEMKKIKKTIFIQNKLINLII